MADKKATCAIVQDILRREIGDGYRNAKSDFSIIMMRPEVRRRDVMMVRYALERGLSWKDIGVPLGLYRHEVKALIEPLIKEYNIQRTKDNS